jgi:hypothetical protein
MSTDNLSLPRPAALWKGMTDAQRVEAARAFWNDEESLMEQAEVLALIARRLNFRLKTVQNLSLDRKVKHLMVTGNVSDAVAGRLLVTYHLASERPMMAAFLDELKIEHNHGLIADTELARPDEAVLAAAAQKLRATFPRERSDLYFSTLVLQDPETWSGLLEIVRGD